MIGQVFMYFWPYSAFMMWNRAGLFFSTIFGEGRGITEDLDLKVTIEKQ